VEPTAAGVCKIISTTSEKISSLPVEEGQLIFSRDNHTIYMDWDGFRTQYSDIISLETEEEREQLESPADSFYFVDETNIFYKYKNGEWTQITPQGINPLYFGGVDSFPAVGNEQMLYITDSEIYKWNAANNEYKIVANETAWKGIN
jgi:hypothetical protein